MEKKVRTLSEILKEADETESYIKLDLLSNELKENKTKHYLKEVAFGLEHIRDIGIYINEKKKLKKLLE